MSGYILCQTGRAEAPYFIENISMNIYSLEELCYYLDHNLYQMCIRDRCTVLPVGIALVHSKYCFPLKKRILICAYPLLAPLTRRETQNFGEEEKLSFFLKLCVYPHEAFLLRELS